MIEIPAARNETALTGGLHRNWSSIQQTSAIASLGRGYYSGLPRHSLQQALPTPRPRPIVRPTVRGALSLFCHN